MVQQLQIYKFILSKQKLASELRVLVVINSVFGGSQLRFFELGSTARSFLFFDDGS